MGTEEQTLTGTTTQQDELLVALLNKISLILNGSDETVAKSPDNYIAWCRPGIPFQPQDLQFAIKGINGKDANETLQLVRNAAEFSRVVNSVPSSNVITDFGSFEQAGTIVWDVYSNVLNYSEVASSDLTPDQQAKIKKFRDLMVVTKTVKDIVTDEEKQVSEDGPMLKAYYAKKAAYEDAALEYNNKRLSALNADDKLAVQDFTLNAATYRSKVTAAMNDWVTNGYKEDVEKINAYIKQVTQKDLTLLKADLQDKLEKGKMTDPNSGSDFYLSSFYPGNFVNSNLGWSKFTFNSESKDTYSKQTQSSTSGNVGLCFGLWSIGGSGGYSKETSLDTMDATGFSMSFSIVQVPIGRPWMSPDFLTNKAWRWKKNMGMDLLSNGENPPKGQMISYPTTAVFVKDIQITSSAMSSFEETVNKTINAGASVGWGPFRIGGSHKQSSHERTTKFSVDKNTLTVEGMQLIAFKCFALPKSPDPSPQITSWA